MENYTTQKMRLSEISPSAINDGIYSPVSEDRITKLANDIKRNGLIEPIIVSSDFVIISGHTRYQALKYLERKFVEIRIAPVHSESPDFLELLISSNDQRVKDDTEKQIERNFTSNPEAYKKRAQQLINGSEVEAERIQGTLKASRSMSIADIVIIKAAIKCINDNIEYLPLTVRRLHYLLLNDPPVLNKAKGVMYENNPQSYKRLSNAITTARIRGHIPFNCITDHTRVLKPNRGYDSIDAFMEDERKKLLSGYSRDVLQSQPRYTVVVCEKETVSNMLNPVCAKYGIPVAYTKGGASLDIRYRLIKDWERCGGKPINILFLSDFDPAGYRIQNTFIGSLQNDFKEFIGGTRIDAYRIGITAEQIFKYRLHSDMSAKQTDNNYKAFVRETGSTKAYELDALPPAAFIDEVERAIQSAINMELYNAELDRYNADIGKIELKRAVLLQHL